KIIPNGVDVQFYSSARPFPEYEDGKINILFVGRLEPRKGAMYLMEAYAKLKPTHPELRLILCSVGPLLGKLRRFVRENRLEAMAAGLPVVASDIHGYKRVVQRNVTGLLVEPRDPDAIAGALERLLCEPALRDRLGQAGAKRAPEYDWSHVTAQLVELYEEVIRKRGVRQSLGPRGWSSG